MTDDERDGADDERDDPDDGRPDEVRERFDWTSVSPSTAVVETIATVAGRDSSEIEPMYRTVDPDALDALVTKSADSASVSLRLTLDRYEVVVRASGDVVVSTVSDGE